MCYMNCPYENYDGECRDSKMMGTPKAGCCDDNDLDFVDYIAPDEDDIIEV